MITIVGIPQPAFLQDGRYKTAGNEKNIVRHRTKKGGKYVSASKDGVVHFSSIPAILIDII